MDEINLASSSYSEIVTFDSVAQKLGVMGVTIVAASGDNGINTSNPPKIPSCPKNPYTAQFPASSAYVLAVGSTQGNPVMTSPLLLVCYMCPLSLPYLLLSCACSRRSSLSPLTRRHLLTYIQCNTSPNYPSNPQTHPRKCPHTHPLTPSFNTLCSN